MNERLLEKMRSGAPLSLKEQILMVCGLSIPSVLAQLSAILMEYIDASMVGHLGANASAAVGLVIATTWLTEGLCFAICTGFNVQVAYRIGAGDERKARETVKYGIVTVAIFSLCVMGVMAAIHEALPGWIGGAPEIARDASRYFLIYGFSLPFFQLSFIAGGMLQCSGDMKTPGVINILMSVFDVIFNFFFIFPSRTVDVLGVRIFVPGAGLEVAGAAIGTALAALCGSALMLYKLLFKSKALHLRKDEPFFCFPVKDVANDLSVSLPVMLGSVVTGLAYIAGTRIVAPLGTIAIAANSFAVTAESLCYMPCYGISAAATTCVGQARGADNRYLMKRFGYLTIVLGVISMVVMAGLLYMSAPTMMSLLSPVAPVREAGTGILRLIVFAEPLFGVSIVAEGVFRGLGRTRTPTILILLSMWFIRIPLCIFLSGRMGLYGVWLGQGLEICIRGLLFLLALKMVLPTFSERKEIL